MIFKKIAGIFLSLVLTTSINPSIEAKNIEKNPINKNNINLKMYEVGKTKKGESITASMPKTEFEKYMKDPQKYTYSKPNHGMGITWESDRNYMTPVIKIGNDFVFCNHAYKDFPGGGEYDDGVFRADLDATIGAIQESGFPFFKSGRPWNISNEQAYVGVFVAINAFNGIFNRKTVESRGNPYVNFLLKQADNKNFKGSTDILKIHNPQNQFSHFNPETKRLESDFFVIESTKPFQIQNLPPQISVVNENGQPQDSYDRGARIRFVTNYITYNGDIVFKARGLNQGHYTKIFSPRDSKKQQLTGLFARNSIVDYHSQINFRPLKVGFIGVKHDESGVALPGARFGMFRANGQIMYECTTDAVGCFSFPMTDVNEFLNENQAYVQEIGTPNDNIYLPQTTKFYFPSANSQRFKDALAGTNYRINGGHIITNHFIKGSKFVLKKVDKDTRQPLAGVQFTLERRAGRPGHPGDYPFTKIFSTNEKGEVVLGKEQLHNFLYGHYIVKEIKSLNGYIIDNTEHNFVINKDGQEVEILIENVRNPIKIIGNKIEENGNPLENVEFGLFTKNNELIESVYTESLGKFEFSPIAFSRLNEDLYVQEIKPQSEKYEKDITKYQIPNISDIDSSEYYSKIEAIFIINSNQNIKNFRKKINIIGMKTDEKEEPLENVEFGIFNEEDKEIMKTKTDKNGEIRFKDISLNYFDGKHYIKEIAPQSGKYEKEEKKYILPEFENLDTDTDFNIEKLEYHINGAKKIHNNKIKIDIIGKKTNEKEEPLNDVKFGIFNEKDKEIIKIKTDEKGEIRFKDISLNYFDGKHYIKEIEPQNEKYEKEEKKYILPEFQKLDTDTNFDIANRIYKINEGKNIVNKLKKIPSVEENKENGKPFLNTGHQNALVGFFIITVTAILYILRKKERKNER